MGESRNILQAAGGDVAFCEECLACGADGVILRICASCGHVGCAEGSPSDHASEHYAETDHPIAAVIGSERVSCWSYPDGRAVWPPRR
ncbi:MAG: UBP-type zinc finger domain-containing protein [Labedaea sp.]